MRRLHPLARAAAAGAVYFTLVFVCAFALGIVRTLWVAPRLGELAAIVLEAPAVLAISWLVCRRTLRRGGVGPAMAERAVMGAVAFSLLMSVEFALSVLAFGRPPGAWISALVTTPGLVGLAAQAGFGLLPIVQRTGRGA